MSRSATAGRALWRPASWRDGARPPAKAGIHLSSARAVDRWAPACAGTPTKESWPIDKASGLRRGSCRVAGRLAKLARMIAPFRHALACSFAALLLAVSSSGPSVLAQAVAQSPSDATASIRPDHQVEDLGRLLDLARERGQSIVFRLEPAAATTAGGGQPEARSSRGGARRAVAFWAVSTAASRACSRCRNFPTSWRKHGVGGATPPPLWRRWYVSRRSLAALYC